MVLSACQLSIARVTLILYDYLENHLSELRNTFQTRAVIWWTMDSGMTGQGCRYELRRSLQYQACMLIR
jgi:hypothetical protein